MHGRTTWEGVINRYQIRDCVKLLSKLVPTVIELMMDYPDTLWGDAIYPAINRSSLANCSPIC